MMKKIPVVLLVIICLSSSRIVLSDALNFEASVNFGSVEGNVQTPAGGNFGTTDLNRPTLDELGFDTEYFYDISLSWNHGRITPYFGTQIIELSGSSKLRNDLLTHAVTFPASEPADADIKFNWYRAGLNFRLSPDHWKIQMGPGIELAMLDFYYRLSSQRQYTDRSYSKTALRLGMSGKAEFSGRGSVSLRALHTIETSDNVPKISTINANLSWSIIKNSFINRADILIGIGYLKIEYNDSQHQLSNDLELEISPFGQVGLAFVF